MTVAIEKTPAKPAGVRPSSRKPVSVKALRKLGRCEMVQQQNIIEGDVVLRDNSSFCVVRKSIGTNSGSLMVFRELGTNTICQKRIQPHSRLSLLSLPEFVPGPDGAWKMASGDVVVYPGHRPHDYVAAIRSFRGWLRTAAPWTPVSDVEVLLDVQDGRARLIRSTSTMTAGDPFARFRVGSMVASRTITTTEDPSVWIRRFPDFWVPNSRGASVSDRMIRYEIRRGTYQVISLPKEPT